MTFVHCGHRVVGWDDAGISGGRGGVYGKSGNCSNIAYFTYFLSMDHNHVTYLFISETELLNIKTLNILSQFI